jgi:uncharacterized membrane protein YfcA
MYVEVVIIIGLAILSFLSGMLGLGVAFAAIPFLSLFMPDLIHQVQPLSLLLNGITALFSAVGFARSKLIDWRRAVILSLVTTTFAPAGSYIAQFTNQIYVWYIYLAAVIYMTYMLFKPVKEVRTKENFKLALTFAAPISILSGLLGVGPGFLLMPTLILTGFNPKLAAGINAFAVTPPSFSALIPHTSTAKWDPLLTIILLIVGAGASFAGARITSLYIPLKKLKQIFGMLILTMTIYRIYILVTS